MGGFSQTGIICEQQEAVYTEYQQNRRLYQERSAESMKKAEIITKTATLYSGPLSGETMDFLRGLAQDYCKVKNYVYGRFSGISYVNGLTPVYNILNIMRRCGLRQELELPAVYYELAITEAVGDIKGMWGVLKNKIRELIGKNENLSEEERLYIRTALKINSVFAAILNCREYEMPDKVHGMELDVKKLNNLIRRLVRRHLETPKQEKADSFLASLAGYRVGDGGLYLTSRVPRSRVFLPVKGIAEFDRQIRIIIRDNDVKIAFPVDVEAKRKESYVNTVYAFIGYRDMLTLSNGNIYGKELGSLVTPETERLSNKNKERGKMFSECRGDGRKERIERIEENNLGRKKYDEQKRRVREKTQNFINAELNRMFREEKLAKIVITKAVTKDRTKNYSGALNRRLSRNFRGYIRERLIFKCRLNAVELTEINSKGTGSVCSNCGSGGKRIRAEFVCETCGFRSTIALNSARNIEKIAEKEGK